MMFNIDVGINTKSFDEGVKLSAQKADKAFDDVLNPKLTINTSSFNKSITGAKNDILSVDKTLDKLENNAAIKGLANDFNMLSSNAGKSISEQKQALAQLLLTGKKGTKEYDELNKELKQSIVLSKQLDNAMTEVSESVDGVADGLEGFDSGGSGFAGLSKGATVALGGVTAVAAGLGMLVDKAGESQQSLNELGAITGKTGDELNALKAHATSLFQKGFGEDLPQAIKATGVLEQQLGKILDSDVADKFAIGLQGAAKALDFDITEGIQKSRSAIQLFGLTSEDELNSFLGLLQKTQNAESDVLDTLNEYAVDVADAGFTFEKFGVALETGIAGGLRNTDKLADVFREFNISITDSDFTNKFKGLSEGASKSEKEFTKTIEKIMASARTGEISVSDAFAEIGRAGTEALSSGELSEEYAKTLRNAIAGTPGEEIGKELFFKIAAATGDETVLNKFRNGGTAAAEQFVKAAEPQGFEGIKRQFMVLIDDIANSIMPALQPIMDLLPEIMNLVKPLIQEIAGFVSELIGSITPIVDIVFQLVKPLLPLINSLLSAVSKLLKPFLELVSKVLQPLTRIIEPIVKVIDSLVNALTDALLPVIEKLVVQIGDILVKNIDVVVKGIETFAKIALWLVNNALVPLINNLTKVYSVLSDFSMIIIDTVMGAIRKLYGGIMSVVDGVGKFFGIIEKKKAPLKKLGDGAEDVVKNVEQITDATETATDATDGLGDAAKKTTKAIIKSYDEILDKIESFTEKANGVILKSQQDIADTTRNTNIERLEYEKERIRNIGLSEEELAKKLKRLDYEILKNKAGIAKDSVRNARKSALEQAEARLTALQDEINNEITDETLKQQKLLEVEETTRQEILAINKLYDAKELQQKQLFANEIEKLYSKDVTFTIETKVDPGALDETKEKTEDLTDFQKDAISESTDFINDLFEQQSDASQEDISERQEGLKREYKEGNISFAEYVEQQQALEQQRVDFFSNAANNLANNLIQSGIGYLQKKLPIWIAEIFGESLGEFGPIVGAVLAGTAVGLLQGLVSSAGAEKGIIGIDESYNTAPGKTDTIPLMVAKGESVIAKKGTEINRDILELANNGIDVKQHLLNEFEKNNTFDNRIMNNLANNKNISEIINNIGNSNIANTDLRRSIIQSPPTPSQIVINNETNFSELIKENIKLRETVSKIGVNVNNYRNYSVNENKIVKKELSYR